MIERQSKHNHQCEQGGRKKPSTGLPENWQAVDGLFVILSAWEFESCVFLKTPKFGGFASPVRYFYFTPPDFSNVIKLFLIALIFLILYAKIPHRSAGFLTASFLSMRVGRGEHFRTPGSKSIQQSRQPIRKKQFYSDSDHDYTAERVPSVPGKPLPQKPGAPLRKNAPRQM